MSIKHRDKTTDRPEIEQTPIGPQFVIRGYSPVSLRKRLEVRANEPPKPKRACVQKPCDIGLFDEAARNQTDLLDALAKISPRT
jgi:hypothetical protein